MYFQMPWATVKSPVQLRAFLGDPVGLGWRSGGQTAAGCDTTAGGGKARGGGDTTGKSCAAGSAGGSASGLLQAAGCRLQGRFAGGGVSEDRRFGGGAIKPSLKPVGRMWGPYSGMRNRAALVRDR